MRIRVQHEDGKIEVLELRGTWTVTDGQYLDRITDENGFEHFFTTDGYYDGWGGPPPVECDAREVLDAVENKRVILEDD